MAFSRLRRFGKVRVTRSDLRPLDKPSVGLPTFLFQEDLDKKLDIWRKIFLFARDGVEVKTQNTSQGLKIIYISMFYEKNNELKTSNLANKRQLFRVAITVGTKPQKLT